MMREPTEAMLNAARDWSIKKYGHGIGNDGAIGCWKAMFDAMPSDPVSAAAPVLLNMVKWSATHDGECLGDHPELLEAARAAISEIEGPST